MISNHNFVHFGEVIKHRNWTTIVKRDNVGFVNRPFFLMLSKWCIKRSDTLRLKKCINKSIKYRYKSLHQKYDCLHVSHI